MASLEAPSLVDRDASMKVMGLSLKLLHWQSVWYEDRDTTLQYYLQYYSPWMARLLVKHRFLRLFVRYFYKFYFNVYAIVVFLQLTVTFPMGIYVFWEHKKDVVANAYCLIVTLVVGIGLLTMIFMKESLKSMIETMQEIVENILDNEEEIKIFRKTNLFCHYLTKYLHIVAIPSFSCAALSVHFFYLLPNRKKIIREWYPFNTDESPNYDITVALRTMELIAGNAIGITLICFVSSMFIYLRTFFKIVTLKIQNLKSNSMAQVKKRSLNTTCQRGVLVESRSDLGVVDHETRRVGPSPGPMRDVMSSRFGRKIDVQQQLTSQARRRVPIKGRRVDQLRSLSRLPESDSVAFKLDSQAAFNGIWVDPGTLGRRTSQADQFRAEMTRNEGVAARQEGGGDLLHIGERPDDEVFAVSADELEKEITKQLLAVVKLHVTVLRNLTGYSGGSLVGVILALANYNGTFLVVIMAQDLGSILNVYLVVMFAVNTVTLAVTALFFTTVENFGPTEIIFLAYSMEIMLLYLMHNYMANVITTESYAVGEAIYFTDWFEASPSFKKSMLIIMTRANLPTEFKPTGLDPLSLKLFTEVTIQAYKMISTLNSFVK